MAFGRLGEALRSLHIGPRANGAVPHVEEPVVSVPPPEVRYRGSVVIVTQPDDRHVETYTFRQLGQASDNRKEASEVPFALTSGVSVRAEFGTSKTSSTDLGYVAYDAGGSFNRMEMRSFGADSDGGLIDSPPFIVLPDSMVKGCVIHSGFGARMADNSGKYAVDNIGEGSIQVNEVEGDTTFSLSWEVKEGKLIVDLKRTEQGSVTVKRIKVPVTVAMDRVVPAVNSLMPGAKNKKTMSVRDSMGIAYVEKKATGDVRTRN